MKTYTIYLVKADRWSSGRGRYKSLRKKVVVTANNGEEAYQIVQKKYADWDISMFFVNWTKPSPLPPSSSLK